MKYIVTISEKRCGNIQLSAQNRDEAKQKAEELAKISPDRVMWDSSKYQVTNVYEKPLVCSKCDSEIPLDSHFCNKCGAKVDLENDIELGKVLSVDFNQSCKTKIMFDTYNGCSTGEKYDTLFLKTFHSAILRNNDNLYISFYLKRQPLDNSVYEISTLYTVTDLKNRYSPGRVTRVARWSEFERGRSQMLTKYYERHPMELELVQAIDENKFDLNGDYFFNTPFAISALNHKNDDNSVVNTKYYIVGANFRKNR